MQYMQYTQYAVGREVGELDPSGHVAARQARSAVGPRPSPAWASTLVPMSEPAHDLPVSSPAVEKAIELARRGVITHLTIHGERVAAIVPESVIEALRAAEDAEDIAEADAAMDEPGESIPWEQVKAELGL
jgi:antitoxin Phd